jgi:ParB family transcriptional regulator, chromosome partitioning protein
MMKKRTGLGKGLSAILQDSNEETIAVSNRSGQFAQQLNFQDIDLDYIETNPYQPRTEFEENALNELSESIKVQGIIQPITVRKLGRDQYQLISGERRFRASKLAGLTKIPAYIKVVEDQQMMEMALIENIQRQDLNSLEIALSYQRLMTECDLKQEELGDRVGKSRSTVTNFLRLLKLPPQIQKSLKEEKISMGHAKALLGIEEIDMQLSVFEKVMAEELSVRKTEELTQNLKSLKESKARPRVETDHSPEIKRLMSELSSHFGTKVNVSMNQNDKGEIKIPFVSIEDLNRILDILKA